MTWLPIFDDHEPKTIVDRKGNPVGADTFSEVVGVTSSDGVSRILPDAFTSPAYLASTIIHEKIHFDQFTTRGSGDTKTMSELEVEAYTKEKELFDSGALGYQDWEKLGRELHLKRMLAEKKALAKAERAELDRTHALPVEEFAVQSHTDKELARIRAAAQELRK